MRARHDPGRPSTAQHNKNYDKYRVVTTGLFGLSLIAAPAQAHFQELIPSTDLVSGATGKTITLDLTFTHPFEGGPVMEMGTPAQFGVLANGGKQDLKSSLVLRPIQGKSAYQAKYAVSAPGDYVFYVEPSPYWEPTERKMIVHYAKVVVDAFGADEGWDAMVGLPVEIQPLVRPYGLWTGNVFRGVVRRDGEPVPFADVEVEWRNDGTVKAPADAFVTQLIKADAQGVFAYAMPRAGWWGFAALTQSDETMKSPAGEMVPVERAALMWVNTVDMK
jgi:cobalt/nickel transport protein